MNERMKELLRQLQEAARADLLEKSKEQYEDLMGRFDGNDGENFRIIRALVEADRKQAELIASMNPERVHPVVLTMLGACIEHQHDLMMVTNSIRVEVLEEWEAELDA